MPVVRYVALAALVVWIGGMMGTQLDGLPRSPQLLGYVCGGVIAAALVVIKFVGPPPRAFFVRLGIVLAMVAITAAAPLLNAAAAGRLATLALAFVLLGWYARE